MPDQDDVQRALERVVDPCSIATGVGISLVDMGMVQSVEVNAGTVRVVLKLTSPVCWQAANIIEQVESVVGELEGVTSVECVLDAQTQWMPQDMNPAVQQKLRSVRPLKVVR